MNLKCKINGKEYPLVQGVTFSEEYNETLDSATIMISQIPQIKDLKPYDDVYIYDNEFNGYPYLDTTQKKQCVFKETFANGYCLENPYLKATTDFRVSTSLTIYDTVKEVYYRDGSLLLEDNHIEFENNYVQIAHYDYDPNHIWIDNDVVGQEDLVFVENECYYYLIYTGKVNQVVNNNTFYKHFLVDQFSETLIRLEDNSYKYKIELFSETKGLEVVQLPNISITQPRDIKKRKNVYKTMEDFIELYTPKQKISFTNDTKNFVYVKKYVLDRKLKGIFQDVYAPEVTLNNPNLRDILTQLMLTKDMIPYVEDGVIKGLDITQRGSAFVVDKNCVNYINGSRSSTNHCDNLRRSYTNALSQDNTCKRIEYLGFRNKDNALMTLDNMRLETRYPIYKINKVYMCYYKRGRIIVPQRMSATDKRYVECDPINSSHIIFEPQGTLLSITSVTCDNPNISITHKQTINGVQVNYGSKSDNRESGTISVTYEYTPKNYVNNGEIRVFLCKQDITPLVKLNSERALLKEDWDKFGKTIPRNINDLAKFRLCTIGYDIGDTNIEGWGIKYDYPEGWWERDKSYIQNIYKCVDAMTPYGIYQQGYLHSCIDGLEPNEQLIFANSQIVTPFTNQALAFKGLFFQVDYNAFYNGCVVHSKDDGEDTITINDNSSNSLMLLENDGLFQKEKINRFGNKATTITARYTDVSQLQPLGSVYGDDEIVYHREYNIYDNCINCVYYATKDYVLKNYYTSVYAKHRPYNLMNYDESVNRAENKKLTILLSTQPQIVDEDLALTFDNDMINKIFSFAKPSTPPKGIDVFEDNEKINCGLIDRKYLSDVNGFVSGNSLCFNMRMYDNVSGGVYIENAENEFFKAPTGDYTGSVQDWYISVDSVETGFKRNMSFELFNYNNDATFFDNKLITETQAKGVYNKLFALPKLEIKDYEKNNLISYNGPIHKDNKEVIDMTFQIEPISAEPNKIIFSQWMMKLSNLLGSFNKFTQPTEVSNIFGYNQIEKILYASPYVGADPRYAGHLPIMILEFDEVFFNSLDKKSKPYLNGICAFDKYDNTPDTWGKFRFSYLKWELQQITEIGSDYIVVKVYQTLVEDKPFSKTHNFYNETWTYKLKKITNLSKYQVPNGKVAFSNVVQTKNHYEWAFDKESHLRYVTTRGELQYVEHTSIQCYTQKIGLDLTPIANISVAPLGVCDTGTNETKTYFQNMYLSINDKEIKKEIVYNEYVTLPYKSNLKVDDVIKTHNNKIVVDLTNIPNTTKSISVWFLDNILYSRKQESQAQQGVWSTDTSKSSYKFVFGVNLAQEDFARGKVEITLSALNNRDFKVYDTNHNVIGRIK